MLCRPRDGHSLARVRSHFQMGLRAAAAGALDQFGAASNYWHLGDSSYESLLSDHFTAVTPEIGCKWSASRVVCQRLRGSRGH